MHCEPLISHDIHDIHRLIDQHEDEEEDKEDDIKSKEQLDSVLYSYVDLEDVINDEFFEEKWLVVSACRVTDSEMYAEITDLGVRNKTLFIRADRELHDTDGVAEPIAPMYYSFVAVDKDALAQVTEIIWM